MAADDDQRRRDLKRPRRLLTALQFLVLLAQLLAALFGHPWG